MRSLWFVTPAWQRFALSAVCFEQWTMVRDALAAKDIALDVVVIADDRNLELAKTCDFHTVRRDNRWLGRKFNDGIEYAARHGAEWIAPIGSDTWVDPEYFAPLPEQGKVRTARYLCTVTADRLAHLEIDANNGGGPYVIDSALLPPSLRPAVDRIHRSTDRSTINGLIAFEWESRDLHRFQLISFRGTPHLTSYDGLVARWGVSEEPDPWVQLAEHYPAHLVDGAREAIA